MTTLAARTIAALRADHEVLATAAAGFSPDQLKGPSGCSDWTVAQVFSHLGSGAEITLATFRAGVGEAEAPGPGFNESVWDRWNAMSPEEQAAGAIESDEKLVAALEAVAPERYEEIAINPGWLPQPIPLAAFAATRLSEVAHHSWDIRVATDPAATLTDGAAELLAEHLSGGLSFFLGFITKTEQVREPAVVEIAGTPYRIVLDDRPRLSVEPAAVTATFTGPLEAAMRLLVGRLSPRHTPPGTEVTGNVTLDELRAIFPGF